ncbi:MAG: phosphonate C-P lyase system protein PhnG [Rhodospirillaceae bacterium]|nr:phosphonate C-P lyase system protein PhnG [Rhodospirillaceae bacterium]
MPTAAPSRDGPEPAAIHARQRWMSVLAKAPAEAVERAWRDLRPPPGYDLLRPAETGLAMIQARMGGSGRPFHLGEMTMTRCAVRLADGTTGFSHIAGRDRRKAELAAAFDALLQRPADQARLLADVIAPMERALLARKQATADKVAATKVEFFTLARGD